MRITFARDLIEESVRLAIVRSEDRVAFERDREGCYGGDAADPEARDARFAAMFDRWFARLDLVKPLHAALAERPRIGDSVAGMRVETAMRRGDQGIELFVAPPDADLGDVERRWLVARVLATTLVDADAAMAMLRPEMLHVSDMLDPAFEYEPELPPSPAGPTHDRLLLERYSALWAASVAYRLDREGRGSVALLRSARARLEAAFPMHADSLATAFVDIVAGRPPLHTAFVTLAIEPRRSSSAPARGSRCSLCGFPTYTFAGSADVERVSANVRLDFPTWSTDEATCPQCVDLYASRLPASP